MHLAAKTTLLAFRWCYRIIGKDLELFDNTDQSCTPKAEKNIKICTGYLDYGVKLLFSPFDTMILNHFRQCLSQYTTHFYPLLRIHEEINNIIGYGPLSLGDLLAH